MMESSPSILEEHRALFIQVCMVLSLSLVGILKQ